ncbi:hypothetical protein D3C81_1445460 [compost metagenome]
MKLRLDQLNDTQHIFFNLFFGERLPMIAAVESAACYPIHSGLGYVIPQLCDRMSIDFFRRQLLSVAIHYIDLLHARKLPYDFRQMG